MDRPGDASVLDVREVDGEPFGEITAALEALSEEETLCIVNSFEPQPLYGVLDSRGFAHETTQVGPEEWRVEVERA